MRKVSRPPLRVIGRRQLIQSALRAPAAVGLALALAASLAPLGRVARAQGAPSKGQPLPVAEEQPVYVINQTPEGDVSCRLATPAEIGTIGEEPRQVPLHQLNHLPGKESASASASAGLTIILRGTDQLKANPQAEQAFIRAAAKWEALISSQITVTIDVDYGTTFFGQAYSSASTLGATSSGGFIPTYTSVRQRLINRAPAGSAEAALLNNLPASSLPTDIGNVTTVFVPTALARALGYTFDESTAPVPRIGFNSSFSFDFNPDDGVTSTQTDFDSVAVHEIGHALGFNSEVGARELDPNRPLRATVWDISRFRPGAGTAGTFSSAPRVLSSGTSTTDPHVYFGGGAEIQLSTGKPDGTGGDEEQASHWKDDRFGVALIGIMDPTIRRGVHHTISANDLSAIDLFGYSVVGGPPPPPPPPGPPNDNFANAQAISGTSGSVAGTNVNATKEAGEQNHSPNNDAGGKSVWYNWTAPSNGSVTFNTAGSSYDTVLAAYTGSSVGALSSIIKNDDVNPGVVVTSAITLNAVGGTTYRIAVDGWDGEEGSVALNWSHTGSGGLPSAVGFSSHAHTASETGGAAVLTLGRSNPGTTVSIGVRTVDDPAAVACNDTTTRPGVAFARCDYATTIETVTFGPNDTTRTISVPLIDDSHGEPDETVRVELFIVTPGVQLGVVPATMLTITSNESQGQDGAANPLDGVPFFVRQHYLDFLSREPEEAGLQAWSKVLNDCVNQLNLDANSSAAGCDRVLVSYSFFGSQEFDLKGRFAFRFYKVAFGRFPEYGEIVTDMRQLTGATGEDVVARRAAFPGAFTQRADFRAAFDAKSNEEFVNTLMDRYNRQLVNSRTPSDPENGAKIGLSRTGMTTALNTGQWTRAQVLRAIADSDEVSADEFRPSFVAMQYYGYLRRTPDQAGFQAWLNYLNANPADFRTMVHGFLNSTEYRLRFGRP